MTSLLEASRASLSDSENTHLALRVLRECDRSRQQIPLWIFPLLCDQPAWPTVHRVDGKGRANGKVHIFYRCSHYIKINSLCGAFGRMDKGPDAAFGETKRPDSISCGKCLASRKAVLPFYSFFPVRPGFRPFSFVHLYPFRRIAFAEPVKLYGSMTETVIVRTHKVKDKLVGVVGRESLDPFIGINTVEELFAQRLKVLRAFRKGAR